MDQRLQTIIKKTEEFKKNLEEIARRRVHWQQTIKPLLMKVLSTINSALTDDLAWEVHYVDMFSNWESIYWTTGSYSSGIGFQKGAEVRTFTVQPGSLFFSQTETGEIFVHITYPFVDMEDLGNSATKDDKFLGQHLPQDITEDTVYDYAEVFVDEMNNWWLNENTKIGYKLNNK